LFAIAAPRPHPRGDLIAKSTRRFRSIDASLDVTLGGRNPCDVSFAARDSIRPKPPVEEVTALLPATRLSFGP
jgi:hypothetical protein